jgi:RNA polymerase sigma factor (TIGR02999 family)
MERILIDHARARGAVKRGGDSKRVSLRDVSDVPALPDLDVIALADATSHLESLSPKNAELVRLRHALGLTNDEVASVLGVSVATLKRRWAFVRAWLHDRMTGVE